MTEISEEILRAWHARKPKNISELEKFCKAWRKKSKSKNTKPLSEIQKCLEDFISDKQALLRQLQINTEFPRK